MEIESEAISWALPPEAASPHRSEMHSSAELLFSVGDYPLARNLYARLHAQDPATALYLERLAFCLMQLKEEANADLCFEKLSVLYPDFTHFVCTANHFYDRGDSLRAKKYYMKALCHQNDDYVSCFQMFKNLGNISLREGDIEQAEEYYHRAQRIHPDSDLLCVNYGSLYLQKKDFTKARDAYEKALYLNPQSAKARMGLALLYRELCDYPMAWANIQFAVEWDSKNASYLKLLCQWALSDFRYDEAIAACESFLAKESFHLEVELLFACLLFQSGQRQYAFWEVQKILAFEPSCVDAQKLLRTLEAYHEVGN